jgi:hypothetical protein
MDGGLVELAIKGILSGLLVAARRWQKAPRAEPSSGLLQRSCTAAADCRRPADASTINTLPFLRPRLFREFATNPLAAMPGEDGEYGRAVSGVQFRSAAGRPERAFIKRVQGRAAEDAIVSVAAQPSSCVESASFVEPAWRAILSRQADTRLERRCKHQNAGIGSKKAGSNDGDWPSGRGRPRTVRALRPQIRARPHRRSPVHLHAAEARAGQTAR